MRAWPWLYPPIWLLLSVLSLWSLHLYLPVRSVIPESTRLSGLLIAAAGALLILVCALQFRRAQTSIIPFEASTHLIRSGVYRYSRNPIYLGMVIILTGIAIYYGSLSGFFVIPLFVVILQYGFIRHEEFYLNQRYGQDWRDYAGRTRRWL